MSGSGAAAPVRGALAGTRPVRLAVAVGILLVGAGAVALLLSGVRLFVVQTPSMGTAAPVGTLVVDAPASIERLAVGDVISFHPPGALSETYTHRVVGIAHGLVETRGDINGAPDPWRVGQAGIVGRAVVLLPGVGWIVRSLPLLLIGGGAVWALTLLARSRPLRAGLRVLGGTVLAAGSIVVLKPLASIEILTTARQGDDTAVTVVSTGLLPVAVRATSGGDAVRLSAGQVGSVVLDHVGATGAYRIAAAVAPDPLQWALLALACAVPMLWVLVIGLPSDDLAVT